MAASNINKIIRRNLNLKPWTVAKNTTEIVNSYVQRFYKQVPDNIKNDLLKPRLNLPGTENRVPLRAVFPRKVNIPIIANKPTSKLRSNGYRSPAITTKNSYILTSKKFQKTPNFKIYTKRRYSYSSSVSSSKQSFIGKKSNIKEGEWQKIYKSIEGPLRSGRIKTFNPSKDYYKHSVMHKSRPTATLFNDLPNPNSVEISSTIRNDLMFIDEALKKRICVVKPKAPTLESFKTPKQNAWQLSLKNWNHQSTEHYNKLTTAPIFKKPRKYSKGNLNSGPSSFRLMPIKRKSYFRKMSSSKPVMKKGSSKIESLGRTWYKKSSSIQDPKREQQQQQTKGFNNYWREDVRLNSLKTSNFKPSGKKSKQTFFNLREALDFVHLNRVDHSLRNLNRRVFQGAL